MLKIERNPFLLGKHFAEAGLVQQPTADRSSHAAIKTSLPFASRDVFVSENPPSERFSWLRFGAAKKKQSAAKPKKKRRSRIQEAMKELRTYLRDMYHLFNLNSLNYWDFTVNAHRKQGIIAEKYRQFRWHTGALHDQMSSRRLGAILRQLRGKKSLSKEDRLLVEYVDTEHRDSKRVPREFMMDWNDAIAKCETVWEKAKADNDYSQVAPLLRKVFRLTGQYAKIFQGDDGGWETPYDYLMHEYENGMTTKQFDEYVAVLKPELLALRKAIKRAGNHPERDFITRVHYDPEKQKELSREIMTRMGFDFQRGRVDWLPLSAHPFCLVVGNSQDVRITNKAEPTNPVKGGLLTAVHETGHGIYAQNLPKRLEGTMLGESASFGVDESMARMWEIWVGQSRPFWDFYTPILKRKKYFAEQLKGVGPAKLYHAINEARPSPVRLTANEIDYNLHIIMRYEIERDLINGKLKFKDLEKEWAAKMKEYLGVTPKDDSQGPLQDGHWFGGAIGYFPTYVLGNMYAAQLFRTMKTNLGRRHGDPDYVDNQIRAGNLSVVTDWVNQKIHSKGGLLWPAELITKVTGEKPNPQHLVDYLWDKYGDIYGVERPETVGP